MKRTDKKLHSTNLETKIENIYLPIKESAEQPDNYFDRSELLKYGLFPINTGEKDEETGEYPVFQPDFERKAHSHIQDKRVNIEKELAVEWANKTYDDGWLFIDGRLENKKNEFSNSIAGIIKSHHAYYYLPQDKNLYDLTAKIYGMSKGERSSVFQPEDENIYTWYLRIHKSNSGKADFGIIKQYDGLVDA